METETFNVPSEVADAGSLQAVDVLQELGVRIDHLVDQFEMLKMELDDYKAANQDLKAQLDSEKEMNMQLRNQIEEWRTHSAEWETHMTSLLKKFNKAETTLGVQKSREYEWA